MIDGLRQAKEPDHVADSGVAQPERLLYLDDPDTA
jgi:hypothetical protein